MSFYRQSCPKRSDPKLVRFRCQLIAYLKFGSLVFDDEVGLIILFFGCRQMSEYFVFSPLSLLTVILFAYSLLSDDYTVRIPTQQVFPLSLALHTFLSDQK